MSKYNIDEFDLTEFPKKIELKHGIEEDKEYYEWWGPHRRYVRGIVIQRIKEGGPLKIDGPFFIFFIDRGHIRTLSYRDRPNRSVVADTIEDALKILEELGINAIIKQ